VHEGIYAQSKADFISKLAIALKEASETAYWLIILNKTEYTDEKTYRSMRADADQLIRIIVSTLKTIRKNET